MGRIKSLLPEDYDDMWDAWQEGLLSDEEWERYLNRIVIFNPKQDKATVINVR